MSGISAISGVPQTQMRAPVHRTSPEGSPNEEAHEPAAEKARERQGPTQTSAVPRPSAEGIGGKINLMG